ncbi:FCD domain-containing protein [Frankia sp. AiPs1]|uniref:FadR/GntR family transcriptional regulator n=1 Tax=Frankia sp. AiPs1 TaxID=573493 RepID=UPI002044CAB3|nr:FCD domain-containing protein [Frankia sp. AiPs1]MCM3920593.1 FCD domain-containing protein [Frankia sp. AiPs1]
MTAVTTAGIRVPKAAELVAATIRRQIITGELLENHLLPSESALMEQFHVSRPTLREAFRILESESLITVRRGVHGGARVQIPNGDVAARYVGYVLEYRGTTMADVYRARAEVEAPLARLVAASATPENIARLEECLAKAETHLDEPSAFIVHDEEFHRLMAELADNQTLAVMLDMMYHIVGTARRRYAMNVDQGQTRKETVEVHRSHVRLVDLIKRGRPDLVHRLWLRHLDEATRHYLEGPLATTVVEMMS